MSTWAGGKSKGAGGGAGGFGKSLEKEAPRIHFGDE